MSGIPRASSCCLLTKSMDSTPYAILDSARHIVAVLVGRPPRAPAGERDSWDDAVAEVTKAVEHARENFSFADGDLFHRRGDFPARLFGVSHGGGQTASATSNSGHLALLTSF